MWPKDARIDQILFLTLFLALGFTTRDWTLHPLMILTAVATCLVTQWVMIKIMSWRLTRTSLLTDLNLININDPNSSSTSTVSSPSPSPNFLAAWPSALITSLGLSLLLRADHYSTMMLASGVAIASKFLLKIKGKHLFNPANFGIVIALTMTQDAWVSPGQWGESGWYAVVFLATGGIVLNRVGRWDTTVMFLATYAGLEALRNAWLGWTWDVWAHRLMSGSLLLFALFMITDPRTIPNARPARWLWAVAIASLTFFLRNQWFIPTAMIWALFALAPLTILLDAIWAAPRFEWQSGSAEVTAGCKGEVIA
jgi:Na+-transporting NADH:ubiquinone oxidoreductase subunit NqrB